MGLFIDWRCEKCGARHGGQFRSLSEVERPPCPSCGHQGEADAEGEPRRDPGPFLMTPDGYFRARRAVGLTFAQAAKHLGITGEHLADIEDGHVAPNRLLLMRMREIYKVTFVREKEKEDG